MIVELIPQDAKDKKHGLKRKRGGTNRGANRRRSYGAERWNFAVSDDSE